MAGDWNEALYICQDKSCDTLAFNSGEVEQECKAMSGCTFHEEIQFCTKTGTCMSVIWKLIRTEMSRERRKRSRSTPPLKLFALQPEG